MAQDDFLTFVERVKQAESRGQRFGKDGKLLTSPKGAQGEMQVMPATQRRPGFGITPIRDDSPDEIARVGRDLLKALDNYYGGNKMYAAAAYNWGKSNVDKWIAKGADFNQLPKETQGYLQRIKPETLPSMTARSAPPPAQEVGPAVMEPPLGISASAAPAPATSAAPAKSAAPAAVAAAPVARAEDLGSGYKAALALSFLGSEDKDRPTTDSELEDRLNETALAEFNKELEDYTPKNALADMELTALNPAKFMQPVKMADGGEVKGQSASKMLRTLFNEAPVMRSDGGEAEPTPEEIAAASRPATFNPNIARQGAAARALAAQRDVNTLPDPRTYAAVSGFLGQAPDQMGFSVMHPDIQGIKKAGEIGFATGLVPAVAPVVAPIARAAGKAATALGMKAEKALDAPVTRTLEGGGRSAEMLRALGAQPSFAVRPKGGHFELRPDASGPGMAVWDDVKQTVSDSLANTKDQPLNNWFNTKYATYLRRDFAAEGDPFVKAADAGKKLHIPNQPLDEDWQTTLNFVRKREGLPSQGFATTPYGKNVEDALDASLNIRELGDLANSPYSINKIPPGIRQFSDTNPEMRVYSLDEIMESGPRAESLRNTMLEMRQPSVSYYGESIAIPKNYQLTNESLQGLTPVQASEKAALFLEWKDTARQKAATASVRKNKDISKRDAGDGYLWVNPPDLSANPQIRQIVQDVGCDGGWCTQQERFAMDYGSGNSRLSILLDNKSRPVAQMTIDDLGPPDPKDFIKSLSPQEIAAFRSNPLYRNIQDDELHLFADSFPQYDQYVRSAPPSISITEIKARGNKADVVNTVSSTDLRKIQDQVKDLDARFDLQYVQNLKGIGLHEVPRNRPDAILKHFDLSQDARLGLKNKFGSDVKGFKAVLDRAININGGSKYFSGNEDDISDIFQKATRDVLRNEAQSIMFNSFLPRAKGGMVERTYNDNRAYL